MSKKRFFLVLLLGIIGSITYSSQAQTLRSFTGVNIKGQLSFDKATNFHSARQFNLFGEDLPGGGGSLDCPFENPDFTEQIRWNPSLNGNRFYDISEMYNAMPQRVVPVLHGASTYMYSGNFNNDMKDRKPLCEDKSVYDPTVNPFGSPAAHNDPTAYLSYTIWASLFASRFAGTPTGGFPFGYDQVFNRHVEGEGFNLGRSQVEYLEIYNETDQSWDGADYGALDRTKTGPEAVNLDPDTYTQFYFTPYQYGALLSAAYDGHQKNSAFEIKEISQEDKQYWGVKNLAGADTKIALAGTADLRGMYLEQLVLAFKSGITSGNQTLPALRTANPSNCPTCPVLPFDAVNFHHYATSSHPPIGSPEYLRFRDGIEFFGGTQGAFPEADNIQLRERLADLIAHVPADVDDKEFWLSEFGYDSHSAATQIHVPNIAGQSLEWTQGQWLTRYFLEAFAARANVGSGLSGNIGVERGFDKLYMYQLTDEPHLTNSLFGDTGILDGDGKPKDSWFHIKTMLSVLGEYQFAPALIPARFTVNGTDLEPIDNPRIYRYTLSGNSNQKETSIYAAWVPNGVGEVRNGSIRIYEALDANSFVEIIEVEPFDEDGRRRTVDPADIETGNDYIQINNLTLTETPLYILFNSKPPIDLGSPSISSISAHCTGCQDVLVEWTAPSTRISYYNVFYARVDQYPHPATVFDPTAVTLGAFQVPGQNNFATISGLDRDVEYYFWVVPYFRSTLGFVGPLLNNLPVAQSSTDGCETYFCQSGLNSNMIQVSGNYAILDLPKLIGSYSQDCNQDIDPLINTNLGIYGTAPFQFEVQFPIAVKLLGAHIGQVSGQGRATFWVKRNCDWTRVFSVILDKYRGWHHVVNSATNLDKVDAIRIVIEPHPDQGVNIGKIRLCTDDSQSGCYEIPPPPPADNLVVDDSDWNIEVQDINTRSAVVKWAPLWASTSQETNQKAKMVNFYTLRYGIALDENNQIVEAVEKEVFGGGSELDILAALGGLVPDTRYYVDILPDLQALNTENQAANSKRVSFKTLPLQEVGERKNKTSEPVQAPIEINPNPSTEQVHIGFSANEFHSYTIYTTNGQLMKEGKINTSQQLIQVDVSDFPSGIYVVAFFGKKQATKAFVVSHR